MENMQEITGVLFDFARTGRIGLPEAVFCQGKPLNVLIDLLRRFSSGKPPILFTRLASDVWQGLPQDARASYDHDALSSTAFAARMPKNDKGKVAIVSAGAADAPVSHEAARTLDYLGITNTIFEDCGVAGLWRLAHHLEQINDHDAVIVVAGMEGALASVVGGLCPRPIFAVPTSIGYGVSSGGKAALDGMLASCAPGISCLNIDNGYGAACAAARVVNLL
ncbi:MAG: nickel pincer cofactor biosynthesis protein LarB [Desulfovibrio sp.]|jgi:hypothetical protein